MQKAYYIELKAYYIAQYFFIFQRLRFDTGQFMQHASSRLFARYCSYQWSHDTDARKADFMGCLNLLSNLCITTTL